MWAADNVSERDGSKRDMTCGSREHTVSAVSRWEWMTRIRSVSVDTVFADRVSHIYKRDFGRGLKGGEDGEEGADGEGVR
jgi:hypothetical protein